MPEAGFQTSPQPQIPTTPAQKKSLVYLIALATLIIGVVLGYFLQQTFPGKKPETPKVPEAKEEQIKVPANALQIQACADHNGTLLVKPEDIPIGPVYMIHQGKFIGVKFMLAKDDFLAGKAYDYLTALGVKAKHVSIGFNPSGHQGYNVPHYHVDVFTVDKEVAESIICQPTAESTIATPSATATHSGQPE